MSGGNNDAGLVALENPFVEVLQAGQSFGEHALVACVFRRVKSRSRTEAAAQSLGNDRHFRVLFGAGKSVGVHVAAHFLKRVQQQDLFVGLAETVPHGNAASVDGAAQVGAH